MHGCVCVLTLENYMQAGWTDHLSPGRRFSLNDYYFAKDEKKVCIRAAAMFLTTAGYSPPSLHAFPDVEFSFTSSCCFASPICEPKRRRDISPDEKLRHMSYQKGCMRYIHVLLSGRQEAGREQDVCNRDEKTGNARSRRGEEADNL